MGDSNEVIDVVVAIDDESNEALYVNGILAFADGPTVYAHYINMAAKGRLMSFEHVSVLGVFGGEPKWPERLSDLRREDAQEQKGGE